MKKSIITQKIIAKSFKSLMIRDSFSQISVSNIMHHAKIRRQTFYNYFQDKEELLTWIFENEFAEIIADNLDYYDWKSEFFLLLRYLDENQVFYQKVFILDAHFEIFFLEQFENLLNKVISDQENKSDYHWSDLERNFICQYNANALCNVAKKEIVSGKTLENKYELIISLLNAQLEHYKN